MTREQKKLDDERKKKEGFLTDEEMYSWYPETDNKSYSTPDSGIKNPKMTKGKKK
jgi:hypothetical protein